MSMLRSKIPLLLIMVIFVLIGSTVLSQDEASLNQSLEAAVRSYQQEYDASFLYQEIARDVIPEAGIAIIYATTVDLETGEDRNGPVEVILAKYENDTWNVQLPGRLSYEDLYTSLSSEIIARINTQPYEKTPDIIPLAINDYGLPWQHGTWSTVSRSYYVHGTGEIDFLIDNDNVAAAKDGTIIYVNDTNTKTYTGSAAWWYWNTVVIKHSNGEFTSYSHLAHNSVPSSIKSKCSTNYSGSNCSVPVKAGDIIGKEGTTGYVTGKHLHFVSGATFGTQNYPDTLDQNNNGSTSDRIYTAFVNSKYNIAFKGYTTSQVAGWPNGKRLQASHSNTCPANVDMPRLYWDKQESGSMCKGSTHKWHYWLSGPQNHYFVIRRTNTTLEFDVLLKNDKDHELYSSSSTNGVLQFPVTTNGGDYYLYVKSRDNTSGNYTIVIKQGLPGTKPLPFNFADQRGSINWVGAGSFLKTGDFNSNGWRLNATRLSDPYMVSPPVNINADNNRYVAINLRVSNFPTDCSQPQLFFNKGTGWSFAEARSVKTAKITTPDVFQTIFFDMKSNGNWTGTVGRLRFDLPQCSAAPNNSWIRVRSIEVTNRGPITADFSIAPATVEVGQAVAVTGQVTGNPNQFVWEWGDGTPNGSGATTTHTFNSPGTYTISFTASHNLDSKKVSKTITVTEAPDNCPTDVTNDAVTDIFDIQAIAGAYGATIGDPNYNDAYDIDGSGTIDVLDIQLAANNFGQPCN